MFYTGTLFAFVSMHNFKKEIKMENKKTYTSNHQITDVSEDTSLLNYDSGLDPFSDDLLFFPPHEKRERWSVSWADLTMTMFIFFVILYVYQANDRNLRFAPDVATATVSNEGIEKFVDVKLRKESTEIYNKAKQVIMDEFISGSNVDLVEDKAVRIALTGDLFFDLGKADLKTEARLQLDRIGKILKENSFIINIVGHTDNLPSHSEQFPTNWELSTARACRVARYLIKHSNLPEDRFFVSGHAFLQPLVPNTTPHNRSLNRRVEIMLMKDKPYAIPTPVQGTIN
jgi:chemotaxis protein MotB